MVSDKLILETQLSELEREYREIRLVAQRYRVEIERSKRRLNDLEIQSYRLREECDT